MPAGLVGISGFLAVFPVSELGFHFPVLELKRDFTR
jgi:hypothetical protein